MSFRILLVEDEPGLAMTLSDLLTDAGYDVETATDGEAGLAKASGSDFHLILLDVMLPKLSGFEVCRLLREQRTDSAIMMLTARTQLDDRVNGLQLGADDYVMKPFEPAELLARVQAMLRRVKKEEREEVNKFRFGTISVNFERAELLKAGRQIALTGKELHLLRYLVENRGRAVSRDELLREVWEYNGNVSSRTVDVHVAWLRQKLEDNPQTPSHIHTIRGSGYKFSA